MKAGGALALMLTCCMAVDAAASGQKNGTGGLSTAVFAGGCFWCMEAALEKVPGVREVISGYTGGTLKQPSYEQVSTGGTGHYEAVQVVYAPQQVRYQQLLKAFWRNIDPYDDSGQFCDKGDQYRAAIFFSHAEQHKAAEASKQALETSANLPKPIVTQIVPAQHFWPAEDYHQDYYKKNPVRYHFYRTACGRDRRLSDVWDEVDLETILADKQQAQE